MYLLKWFLKRLTKIYNGILGRINFKWTPVIVNFFWLLKKVSFSLLTTTLYVCTCTIKKKCGMQTHIWISKNLYIFLDASTNILTGRVIIGCHISALQITLFTQGAADEGNALLIFSFGVCRTMMVYCCTIYQNVLWHWRKSNIWTF